MINEIAEMLDNSKYPLEITEEIIALAKENNVVIVFGACDDLMEFRGAIDEEIGAYNGVFARINKNGLFDDHDCGCEYALAAKNACSQIRAIWNNKDRKCSWLYKTDIPHTEFTVFEGNDVFCYGIVFSLDNLTP